ncbi:uncharacterized protein LOC125777587 [Bactrocera dorsalis]|uniref:Uncharacterized protein LOC125777587 n=1 Tax=Bactrocera dorsalis TaxID=27457 RepID=A0ABM3JHD3_BACDO|nr:uncharacterized protein LOC125777587 [Bactrocera dorsalis]
MKEAKNIYLKQVTLPPANPIISYATVLSSPANERANTTAPSTGSPQTVINENKENSSTNSSTIIHKSPSNPKVSSDQTQILSSNSLTNQQPNNQNNSLQNSTQITANYQKTLHSDLSPTKQKSANQQSKRMLSNKQTTLHSNNSSDDECYNHASTSLGDTTVNLNSAASLNKAQKYSTSHTMNNNFTTDDIVSENLDVLRNGILPNHCSIYTSEIFAIYQAALIASKTKGNFCICTDSRSAIDAFWKFKKDSVLVTHTRDLLIKHKNKIKLMWIPGHGGIQGNELADSVAKSLHNNPVICFDTFEKSDLSRHVRQYINNKSLLKWKEYVHHYADINPTKIRPTFPSDAKQSDILVFTRLRLGHTQITHGHLLSHGVSLCNVCGAMSTSVKHILDICPRFSIQRQRIFGLTVPSQLLSDTAALNISKISSFIASCNLSHLI